MSVLGVIAQRLREAQDQRKRIQEENEIRAMMHTAGAEGVAYAKMNAPFATGQLRESIGYQIVGDTVVITSSDPKAPFVEYGTGSRGEMPTGPYVIEPKRAKALKFEVGGKTVFAKRVIHPGVRPRPFLRPATRYAAGVLKSRGKPRVRDRIRVWFE